MKLARYLASSGEPRLGLIEGEDLAPLRVPAGLTLDEALIAVAMGDIDPDRDPSATKGPLGALPLLTPIGRPASVRDFMLYEEHVANCLKPRNREVPAAWYREPSFYFANPHTLVPSGGGVAAGPEDGQLDYEAELGVLIGRNLESPSPAEAAASIAGFMLLNDFSLRDRQRQEASLGLGPSKSKDFATAVGPYLVTPDEILGAPARPRLTLEVRVNGILWSQGDTGSMHFDLGEAIAHAAAGSRVAAGDLIGSGTVPTGCILELIALGRGDVRWLMPDDEVELSAAGLGALTTTVSSAYDHRSTSKELP